MTSSLAGSRDSSTRPEEKSVVNGKAAYMVTLGSVPLVGVAAGNLFIGDYKTNAQSPKDSPKFGRSFTGARPTGLKGWYKYTSKPVDYVGNPDNLKMMNAISISVCGTIKTTRSVTESLSEKRR